jgi:hypothetical protein
MELYAIPGYGDPHLSERRLNAHFVIAEEPSDRRTGQHAQDNGTDDRKRRGRVPLDVLQSQGVQLASQYPEECEKRHCESHANHPEISSSDCSRALNQDRSSAALSQSGGLSATK